jgi:RNA polymerase sigma-70 factor (ECF subfamily)
MTRDRDEFDIELMRCLAEGDDLALNRLMDAWSQPLIAYLTRLTGSDATAQDLAQETFVRVYRHRLRIAPRRNFPPGSSPSPPTSPATTPAGADGIPKHSSGTKTSASCLSSRRMLRPTSKPSPTSASPPCKKPSPQLPQDMREVLILSTWHGMSHAEIARVQNTSEKAVELRLYRARKLLRDLLSDQLKP